MDVVQLPILALVMGGAFGIMDSFNKFIRFDVNFIILLKLCEMAVPVAKGR